MLNAALPLSELLWRRAVEAGPVDTPERRAGLTQTLRTTVATIRDETVRRYYRDDIEERLRSLSPRNARAAGPSPRGGRTRFVRPGEPVSPRITGSPSPSMTASAGFTGAAPVREAVIVGTLLAHPEMLADFAEEIAELDFEDPDARALLSVLLACAAEDARTDPDVLQNRITRAGLSAAAERILTLARSRDRNTVAPHADPAQRADALRQAMILHQQAGALHSELREARQAFENDPTDAGWAWLCEVKARLETVIAAEAEAEQPLSSDSTAA